MASMGNMDTTSSRSSKDPSKLSFQSTKTRRLILTAYWGVILLAIPLWWRTTSIERQTLPTARVNAQQGKELTFPIHVHLDVSDDLSGRGGALYEEVQRSIELHPDLRDTAGLRIRVSSKEKLPGAYRVVVKGGSESPIVDGRRLIYGVHPESHTLSMELADALATLLSPYSTLRSSQAERVAKYAPRYRLAFTLLNEDAASGTAALSWDVHASLSSHIAPTLERLSVLHNFTVESQVQFYAPLAFEPRSVGDGSSHGLTQEDLTVFINSAEWTLSSSVSNDPVLHFVLFIPSSSHSPLCILDSNGTPTSSTAFILPQWGGIVIYNPPTANITLQLTSDALSPVFTTFQQQLIALLGVPALPAHIHTQHKTASDATFTDWQLDALIRRRAVENTMGAQDTLQSIVRLVTQIENMPVKRDVKNDVQEALMELEEAYAATSFSSALALQHASEALTLASRAFFNPGMLALLYFPAEHNYAVYAPLFASISAPLVAALIREIVAWKRARKAKQEDTAVKLKDE
ncbi:uncharacterized protein FIBRA_06571 [Fibroporia radiculosa]|uniref:GPI transamidase component PIG-S n=1 Tax=Fibroporia radiculosa TaxID=599839 RepID=J4GT01_9APHY|nr:uncharacterized protein FIBRA_06571 [Fibroporia radiculosa]CCM04395.1 predicted protein [Fibroporia radiculosa]